MCVFVNVYMLTDIVCERKERSSICLFENRVGT